MVKMTDQAAGQIEDRFDNLSNEFSQTKTQVSSQKFWLEDGTGEFSEKIADGVVTFYIGWRDLLDAGRISAGLIAGNTNAMHVDLNAIDQDYSHMYDLSGNSTAPPPMPRGGHAIPI